MSENLNQIQKELKQAQEFMLKLDEGLVVLSEENVAKVEAMIKTDSSYTRGSDINYTDSSAYLFNKLKSEIYNTDNSKKLKENSSKTIYDVVCAVDRENSTHINADRVGRQEITDRISDLTIKDFLKYLKNPKNLELFNIISAKTSYAGGIKYRTNQSFASKFCHYACFYMFSGENVQDNYSIYDNVLKKILPLYAKKYCIPCITNNLEDYSYYRDIVDKILEKSGNKISRNGFDHLLWYYHKGRL